MIRGYLRTLRNYLRTSKGNVTLQPVGLTRDCSIIAKIHGYLRTLRKCLRTPKGNVTLHPVGATCDCSTAAKIRGYLRTLRNYLRTSKAQHDLKDYARALATIMITTAIILFLIGKVST